MIIASEIKNYRGLVTSFFISGILAYQKYGIYE